MSDRFRTVYDRVEIFSEPGNPIYKDYGFVNISEDPLKEEIVFKEIGEYSIYDEIQAYKDVCDLHKILERYAKTGDESILNKRAGVYADISDMPTNFGDYMRMAASGQALLDSLPEAAREAFNSDPNGFIKDIGTEKFRSYFETDKKDEVNDGVEKQSE